MVGSDEGGWKLEVTAKSSVSGDRQSSGYQVLTLDEPIPFKAGYYFGLEMEGAPSAPVPFSDDSSWAQADIPSSVNPFPLGTASLLLENSTRYKQRDRVTFSNMKFRTYSYEIEDKLGPFAYSTFDYTSDGWGIYYVKDSGLVANSQPGGLKYDPNQDNLMHHEPKADGVNWYYQASQKFVDILPSSYGSELRFQLKQKWLDKQFEQPRDVMLFREGAKSLYHDTRNNPGTGFTNYTVPFKETFWKHNNGSAVSKIRAAGSSF